MNTTDRTINEESIWLSATPAEFAQTLPFYVMEAGFFMASNQYIVERQGNGGFLFLYTMKKYGKIKQNQHEFDLPENHAVIIDCSQSHKYCAGEEGWDFIWFWMDGNGVKALYDILYPDGINAIDMQKYSELKLHLPELVQKITQNDVKSYLTLSAELHNLLNTVMSAALDNESDVQKKDYSEDIEKVLDFIKTNYPEQITLDDMIEDIHISKYHFIRLFRRVMGVTPYHYLTTYRINEAKTLLCTTDRSISEIAFDCGFLDASQFIRHFKKYVGMKPFQYRAYFKQYIY